MGSNERGIGRKVQIHTRALRSKWVAAGMHIPGGGNQTPGQVSPGVPRAVDLPVVAMQSKPTKA